MLDNKSENKLGTKLKLLLLVTGVKQIQLAKQCGISRQQQSNKINNAAYKLDELVELAELTGTKLAFLDRDNSPVVIFDVEDL